MSEFKALTSDVLAERAPVRSDMGHKGTFGTALICAGSEYMTGALVLSTESCLRSGVGMARAFSVDEALLPIKVNYPCALTSAFEDSDASTVRKLNSILPKVGAVGMGSGIDESDSRYKAILVTLINSCDKLVLDAGALNLISKDREYFFALLRERKENNLSPIIMTPHVGEFKRLTGNMDLGPNYKNVAKELAEGLGIILVLKSSTTYIFTPDDENYSLEGNNSGLAKGGSGDILMGLITGLYAQGVSAIDAAICGSYIHSLAGLKGSEDLGKRVVLPEDLPLYFGECFDEIGW